MPNHLQVIPIGYFVPSCAPGARWHNIQKGKGYFGQCGERTVANDEKSPDCVRSIAAVCLRSEQSVQMNRVTGLCNASMHKRLLEYLINLFSWALPGLLKSYPNTGPIKEPSNHKKIPQMNFCSPFARIFLVSGSTMHADRLRSESRSVIICLRHLGRDTLPPPPRLYPSFFGCRNSMQAIT